MKRAALLALTLFPSLALAHSPFKGLNSFYNGALHPALVPAHLTLLLAAGLLIGRQGPQNNRAAVIGLLLAAVVGLTVSRTIGEPDLQIPMLVATTLLALLVALEMSLPPMVLAATAAAIGFSVGLDSNPQVFNGKALTASLIGSGLGLYLLTIYPMALSESLQKRPWQRVLVRVFGSWLAASAILVLALQFAPQQMA
jgi:hydrogenase/urease accessory protein HupE